jgi:hypothetical protein
VFDEEGRLRALRLKKFADEKVQQLGWRVGLLWSEASVAADLQQARHTV